MTEKNQFSLREAGKWDHKHAQARGGRPATGWQAVCKARANANSKSQLRKKARKNV